MLKINILLVLTMINLFTSNAQMVESKTYSILLNGLLSHNISEIEVNEASKKKSDFLFLDARAIEEYNVSHIENSIWVGYDEFLIDSVESIEKDKKIIVYCSIGYRSEKIAEKLLENGYTNVQNLYGGIFEWKNKGYELLDINNKATDSIHAYNKAWGIWLNNGIRVYE